VGQYIVRAGRLVRDEHIERGAMLVRPEEEWRAWDDRRDRFVLRALAAGAVFYVLMVAYFYLVWGRAHPGEDMWRSLPLVLVFVAIIAGGMVVQLVVSRGRGGSPAVGLYEQGVQVTHDTFLPYSEVGAVERTPGVVRVTERVRRRGYPFVLWRWGLSMDLLGEEGARELEERVAREGA